MVGRSGERVVALAGGRPRCSFLCSPPGRSRTLVGWPVTLQPTGWRPSSFYRPHSSCCRRRCLLGDDADVVDNNKNTTSTAAITRSGPSSVGAAAVPAAPAAVIITFRQIVTERGNNCQGDYRNFPVDVQDTVNVHLGKALLQEPIVPITVSTPPPMSLDVLHDRCHAPPFVGIRQRHNNDTSSTPPPLYQAFMFSHELDLLEARLYEGMGIVDRYFIGESGYTHRGHKKPKFVTESLRRQRGQPNSTDNDDAAATGTGRFAAFADVMEIVDLDRDCPEYLETILKYRNMVPRPIIIWETQTAAQACLARAVRNYAAAHQATTADEALVHVSDLDEIPLRSALAAVKHCRLSDDDDAATTFPLPFYTTHEALAVLCAAVPYPRLIGGLLFRAVNMTSQRRPPNTIDAAAIYGGVHLTYFGGSLVHYFKTTNHAEGGQLNKLGWMRTAGNDDDESPRWYNPTVCNATREDWYRREQLLCNDAWAVLLPPETPPPLPPPPVVVAVRRNSSSSVLDKNGGNGTNEETVPLLAEERVGDDNLPWVLAHNRKRYPCIFADHIACVDSFINALL